MQNRIGELSEYYATEYLDKVFYFCLKKTGTVYQAQDLASEISLCILEQLAKGVLPDSFHGWVWQIARNRYARWAERRHRRQEKLSGWDVSDLPEDDLPVFEDPEESLIAREQLELLRRELAFTGREYRDILVAYYFDQTPISEIAKNLSLPEGTVKTRLFRGRNRLKEGMNMARTFGRRSISPESISYSGSGSHPSGLPNSALQRKIPQNIVLEAHNNPSTPEDLSMELGIALPYMEEEIQILHDASLLTQTEDGRYITNFFIADKDTQAVVSALTEEGAKNLRPLMWDLICEMEEKLLEEKIKPDSIPTSDFRWLIALECIRKLTFSVQKEGIYQSFHRPDGGTWGLIGYENNFHDRLFPIGHNGSYNGNASSNGKAEFWVYGPHFLGFDIPNECMGHKLLDDNIFFPLFQDVITGKRTPADFSANERAIWDRFSPRYFHEENGKTIPDLPIYRREVYKRLWYTELPKCRNYTAAQDASRSLNEKICGYLRSVTDPVLHSQLDYVASMMNRIDSAVLLDLSDSGKLIAPENPSKTNATCYFILD